MHIPPASPLKLPPPPPVRHRVCSRAATCCFWTVFTLFLLMLAYLALLAFTGYNGAVQSGAMLGGRPTLFAGVILLVIGTITAVVVSRHHPHL